MGLNSSLFFIEKKAQHFLLLAERASLEGRWDCCLVAKGTWKFQDWVPRKQVCKGYWSIPLFLLCVFALCIGLCLYLVYKSLFAMGKELQDYC